MVTGRQRRQRPPAAAGGGVRGLLFRCTLMCNLLASSSTHPTSYIGSRLSSVAGPFRTVLERFEHCPDPTEPRPRDDFLRGGSEVTEAIVVNVTRLTRQRGTRPQPQQLAGNVTLHRTLDDASFTLITIDKWNNNQWKRNAFVMRLPGLCSSLRGLGVLSASACPARRGVYPFENLASDWQFAAMPHFYYGTWRAEAVFHVAGGRAVERAGCVRWLFETSPAWPDQPEQPPSPGAGQQELNESVV